MKQLQRITLLIISLGLISGGLFSQIQNVNPDPNGEPWYVGGDRELTEEEKLQVEKEIPELQVPKDYKGLKNLPDYLDNSNQPYFRDIFNQLGGSCSQASGIAYHFTYEIDYARGVPAEDSVNLYPSHYTYNFLNKGSGSNGSNYWDGWKIIDQMGCPNMETYGGLYCFDNQGWMNGYDNYYAGMYNTTLKYYSIDVSTPEGLNKLKAWFYNHMDDNQSVGGLANFSAGASDWVIKHLPFGTPNATDFVIELFDETIDHAMTFVGYDDSVRYDFNGDGLYTNDIDQDGDGVITLSDWEVGALIMVNSWGYGWGDGGKCFVPYRHLTGENHIRDSKVFVLEARDYYEPEMALKLSLSHNNRGILKIFTGASYDVSASEPVETYDFLALNKRGGEFPMDGYNDSLEIGLDITDFYTELHEYEDVKIFIGIQESDEDTAWEGQVHYYSVMSYLDGVNEYACQDSNIIIENNGLTYLSVVIPGNGFYPPSDFQTSLSNRDVSLSWDYPEKHPAGWEISAYNIYRNNELIASLNDSTLLTYTDMEQPDGSYEYGVSCIYVNGADEYESMKCDVKTVNLFYDPIAGAGNELYFDGGDDYILTDSVDIAGKSFTIEFWANKGQSYHDDMVIGQGDWGTGSRALHLGFRDDRFYCGFYGDDIGTDSTLTYTDNQWHHFCVTFDALNYEQILYVDGEIVQTRTSDTLYLGEGPFYIGAIDGDMRFFRGYLEDIRVWDVVLSEAEIEEYMMFPPDPDTNGLIAFWRFDERNGSTAIDASQSENHGHLKNFDPKRYISTLWKYHVIDEDTVLNLFAGYSPVGASLNFELLYPAMGGDMLFDNANQSYTYTPNANWAGYDSLVYIADDGAGIDTCWVYINYNAIPMSIEKEFVHDIYFQCYPNPAIDELTLEFENAGEEVNVRIFTLNGQMKESIFLSGKGKHNVNVSAYPAGMYILDIIMQNQRKTQKISILK